MGDIWTIAGGVFALVLVVAGILYATRNDDERPP